MFFTLLSDKDYQKLHPCLLACPHLKHTVAYHGESATVHFCSSVLMLLEESPARNVYPDWKHVSALSGFVRCHNVWWHMHRAKKHLEIQEIGYLKQKEAPTGIGLVNVMQDFSAIPKGIARANCAKR